MTMRILGIDPGVERVGIAVIEKTTGLTAQAGKEILLYSDCFKTSSKLSQPERLVLIGEEIARLIAQWQPEMLGIEKLFFENNQKTAMVVAEARGVIIYEGRKVGLKINEYTPLEIKVAVTGYGKATKEQVEKMVEKLIILPQKKRIDDELDAIAVALTASAHRK